MIFKIYDEISKTHTYTFTGRHIYTYIHYFAETSTLNKVKLLLINYSNEETRKTYENDILYCKNGDILMDAINKMMNGEKVIYIEKVENIIAENARLKWFNSLFLNQYGGQIRPPIDIPDPYKTEEISLIL
jgi:hypothetical protein